MGLGKSNMLVVMAEALYSLRYRQQKVKIFDLFDDGRGENMFWIFPNDHDIYKHSLSRRYWYIPKEYPVRLLFPVTRKLPKKLPIQSKVFAIPIDSLTINDIYALVGEQISQSQRTLWNRVQEKITRNTTPVDLKKLLEKMQKGEIKLKDESSGIKFNAKTYATIVNGILGELFKENMLCAGVSKLALNLKEEINDKDVISVLVLKYCPPELRGFLVNYFIRHIYDALNIGSIKKPKATYFLLREVSKLLKSDVRSESDFAIRDNIEYIIRQGRGPRTYFIMDTQYLSNLSDVKSMPSRIIAFRTHEGKDILEALGYTRISNLYTRENIATLPLLPQRWCYVFEKGKKVFLTKVNVPRHKTWNHLRDEFEILYMKHYGEKYYDITEDIKKLEEENNKSREYWEEKEREIRKKYKEKPKVKTIIKTVPFTQSPTVGFEEIVKNL